MCRLTLHIRTSHYLTLVTPMETLIRRSAANSVPSDACQGRAFNAFVSDQLAGIMLDRHEHTNCACRCKLHLDGFAAGNHKRINIVFSNPQCCRYCANQQSLQSTSPRGSQGTTKVLGRLHRVARSILERPFSALSRTSQKPQVLGSLLLRRLFSMYVQQRGNCQRVSMHKGDLPFRLDRV